MPRYEWKPITDWRGGRNAASDPLSIGDTQAVQMRNGDTYRTSLFRKPGGATAPAIGTVFTGVISSLLAHYPSNNPAAAELWGADDAATPNVGRMAAASTFSAPTLTDALSAGAGKKLRGVSYNGKLFLLYDSVFDVAHVYDATMAAPRVRRVGLAAPSAAPTVADQGAGTYAAITRYYRQRYRIKAGAVVVAQSEPSASVSFLPSGTGASARVTKAATISESETHWVLEASEDGVTFYEIAETVVGTTTSDDITVPSFYGSTSSQPLSPVLGSYTRPTSAKYGIAAFNRLLLMGNYEGGPQSRVWFSPSKGTSDKGDDERIPDTLNVRNFLDLDEGTGGDGTGFAGPIYGSVYIFKYSQVLKITPTGGSSPIFDKIELSMIHGALDQECITVGEDAQHRPCVYFMDPQIGPMIVGSMPPTEIGQGVRDIWDIVNLAATTKAGQVVDYPKLGQVWFWIATGASNAPDTLMKYTKATGAWSVSDTGGKVRLGRCAVLFPRTLGATMSRDRVPYVGYDSSNNKLLRADTTDTDEDGTACQALVKSRPYLWNGGKPFRTTAPWILAKAAAGVTLTVTADGDFGKQVKTTTIDLTLTATEAAGGATRVWRQAEGLDLTDACAMQIQIGDAAAAANTWQIERVYVPVLREDVGP